MKGNGQMKKYFVCKTGFDSNTRAFEKDSSGNKIRPIPKAEKFSTAEIFSLKRADDKMRLYLISWSAENRSFKNHYTDGKLPYDLKEYLKFGESGGLFANYDPD